MTTATETLSERKAARLLEQAETIEVDADRAAETLRREWRAEQDKLRRDPDLTTEAVQRRANECFEPLKKKMAATRADYNKRREALLVEARRECFGRAPTSGDKLLAWRDARDRAALITDRQVCEREMRRALESDDTVLAAALAERAHDAGWGQGISTRFVSLELLQALSTLERPPSNRALSREMFRWNLPG